MQMLSVNSALRNNIFRSSAPFSRC